MAEEQTKSTKIKFPKGSEWRKWDLHFHTPSSYDYKDSSVTNEEIISTLVENDIEVVAITDHHVIDVERIKELSRLAADKGITVLPGIEFLSGAGGSNYIHFIAIFSEDLSGLDHTWDQIKNRTEIAKIYGETKKNPNEIYCNLNETIKIVKELGGLVTIHAGKKSNSIECIKN
jgi:histidinol phosphatase-like PHP family hydrolase